MWTRFNYSRYESGMDPREFFDDKPNQNSQQTDRNDLKTLTRSRRGAIDGNGATGTSRPTNAQSISNEFPLLMCQSIDRENSAFSAITLPRIISGLKMGKLFRIFFFLSHLNGTMRTTRARRVEVGFKKQCKTTRTFVSPQRKVDSN